ncbi:hypothetical protein E2C01_101052 [Portunus trituberculatus]|uniref:Uncharacterized protein n=1 Tax=Portunus trituberculatus TaxID=210409 RepID=A0A5B7KEM2_PORTR|nr:hypothetical protein [Portunus trituberculatus]
MTEEEEEEEDVGEEEEEELIEREVCEGECFALTLRAQPCLAVPTWPSDNGRGVRVGAGVVGERSGGVYLSVPLLPPPPSLSPIPTSALVIWPHSEGTRSTHEGIACVGSELRSVFESLTNQQRLHACPPPPPPSRQY